jgi:hypothetical protein
VRIVASASEATTGGMSRGSSAARVSMMPSSQTNVVPRNRRKMRSDAACPVASLFRNVSMLVPIPGRGRTPAGPR